MCAINGFIKYHICSIEYRSFIEILHYPISAENMLSEKPQWLCYILWKKTNKLSQPPKESLQTQVFCFWGSRHDHCTTELPANHFP